MADNHLRILHFHHLHRHGNMVLQYFDFKNIKFVADSIKGLVKSLMKNVEVKMNKVKTARRKIGGREKEKTWYECPNCRSLGILCMKLNN